MKDFYRKLMVLLAVFTLCGITLVEFPPNTKCAASAGTDDFTIILSPQYQEVYNGGSAVYNITVSSSTPTNVTLSVVKDTVPTNWIVFLDKRLVNIINNQSTAVLTVVSPIDAKMNETALIRIEGVLSFPDRTVTRSAGTYTVVKDVKNTAPCRLAVDNQYKEIGNGRSVNYNITLSSELSVTVNLGLVNVPQNWIASLSEETVPLSSNSTKVYVKVTAPLNAKLDENATIYIIATTTTRGRTITTSIGTYTVVKNISNTAPFSINIEKPLQIIRNGATAVYDVLLLSTESGSVSVNLSTANVPSAWNATLDDTTVMLNANQTIVKLRVTAPVDAQNNEQAAIQVVGSTSVTLAGVASQVTLSVSLLTAIDTTGIDFEFSEIVPIVVELGQEKLVNVSITNTGNDFLSITTELRAPIPLVNSTTTLEAISLKPGTSKQVDISVKMSAEQNVTGAYELVLIGTSQKGEKRVARIPVNVVQPSSPAQKVPTAPTFTIEALKIILIEKENPSYYAASIRNIHNTTIYLNLIIDSSAELNASVSPRTVAIPPSTTIFVNISVRSYSETGGNYSINLTGVDADNNFSLTASTVVRMIERNDAASITTFETKDIQITINYITNTTTILVVPVDEMQYLTAVIQYPNGTSHTSPLVETESIWMGRFTIGDNGAYVIKLMAVGLNNETHVNNITVWIQYPTYEQSGIKLPSLKTTVAATSAGAAVGVTIFLVATEFGRYAILQLFIAFIIPLYTKLKRSKLLDHYAREQIYKYIQTNPGENYTTIMQKLKLKNGALAYHLATLEREEMIKSMRDGIYKRFYPTNAKVPLKGIPDLTWFQLGIFNLIKDNPGITQGEIANRIGESRQVANYHIHLMMNAGLLRTEKNGREVKFYLANEEMYCKPTREDFAREGMFRP
ncbi:MAG: winged helix-turn-helix transcriptional regulator [Thermoplasmata archaeon]